MTKRIAIFASGSGTNAENIIRYFRDSDLIKTSLVLTNNSSAGVIERAERLSVPCFYFSREEFQSSEKVLEILKKEGIDYIILAGFLLLVPIALIRAYQDRIINIHPALLPAFGGKGFYGEKVHKAVISSGQVISGITIHHVNEHFDEGEIIFQAACHVDKSDDEKSLAAKIHELEQSYFPQVIKKVVLAHQTI